MDLHAHLMGHLGFGGTLLYGGVDVGSPMPLGPDCQANYTARTIDDALGHDNPVHGGKNFINNKCGDYIRNAVVTQVEQSLTQTPMDEPALGFCASTSSCALAFPGMPRQHASFENWPRWNDVTHQKMWVDWVQRAHWGGLNVMVALAVNSKVLADMTQDHHPEKGDQPTDDKGSGDLQIQAIKDFASRHSDWVAVAYDSTQLHDIVARGHLAIVLGVELDNIGDLVGNVPAPALVAEVDRLYKEGVRYIFPIHLVDNPIGGTAVYIDEMNKANKYEEGAYWTLACADRNEKINYIYNAPPPPSSGPRPDIFEAAWNSITNSIGQFAEDEAMKARLHTLLQPGPTLDCNNSKQYGNKNARGLNPSGIGHIAIKQMMKHGMLIDIDHMSSASANGTLDLAFSVSPKGYPLNSGHNGLRGFFENGKSSERSFTAEQYQKIGKLHGMAGIGSAQTASHDWARMYNAVLAEMHKTEPTAAGGFGTDFNGLELGMPPPPKPVIRNCEADYVIENCEASSDAGTARHNACVAAGKKACLGKPPVCVQYCDYRGTYLAYDSVKFPMGTTDTKSWDYNAMGVAHYGMLPDYVQDVARNFKATAGAPGGASLVNDSLMNGAEYFYQTWKRAEEQGQFVK